MTETAYQAARKLMQRINLLRGQITTQKGKVAHWTAIEFEHRKNGKIGQADGAKKYLDKVLVSLKEKQEQFTAMVFPDSNLKEPEGSGKCENCGEPSPKGSKLCGECEERYTDFKVKNEARDRASMHGIRTDVRKSARTVKDDSNDNI